MSFNGSGVFTRLYSWVIDASNNIDIRSDRMDADSNDIATGLSNCITKDGQQTVTANIPMNSKRFTGLGSGVASTDSSTLKQVQNNAVNYAVATGTANAIALAMTPTNTALTDGQVFTFMATALNTGATTLAVDGLTAHAIVISNGSVLVGGEIIVNGMYDVVYSATNTNFTILNSALSSVPPTNITGNAGTATALATARNINGISFNGTAGINIPANLPRTVQTSTYAPTTSDLGSIISFAGSSGSATWTIAAGATNGAGWWFIAQNPTSNILTLKVTTNTLDGIAGSTGYPCYPNESRLIACDGTNYESIVLHGFSNAWTSSGSFAIPPGYKKFLVEVISGGGAGAVRSTTGNSGGGAGGVTYSGTVPTTAFVAAGSTETITVAASAASVATSNANGTAANNSGLTINGISYITSGGSAATNAATGSAAAGGISPTTFGSTNVANLNSSGWLIDSLASGGGVTTGNAAAAGVGGTYTAGGGASTSSNNTAAAGGIPAYTGPSASGTGGARGASSGSSPGGNGVAPGGGGGGAVSGGASGSGAAGQVTISGIV